MHALEYYIADNSLSKFAALGKEADARGFIINHSTNTILLNMEYSTNTSNGEFLSPLIQSRVKYEAVWTP